MPDLINVQALVTSVGRQTGEKFDKSRLYYVTLLGGNPVKIDTDVITWVTRSSDFGMAPLVSSIQKSPVVGQGGYNQFRSGALESRFVKQFTRDELNNIKSPDKLNKIKAKRHLEFEYEDYQRRIFHLREYVGHCVTARGSLRYVNNDKNNRMDVNITFPIQTKTATATWATAATDIITEVQGWLDEYALKGYGVPDFMRMTTGIWRYIKNNTGIKTMLSTYLRTSGIRKGDIPAGMITKELVSQALDWPRIEIYDERAGIKYSAEAAVSFTGTGDVITLNGTFGINVGDTVLVRYDENDNWDDEGTVTAVTHGASVTVDGLTADISAADAIVVKPTFFPEQKVLFGRDEKSEMSLVLAPFGIEVRGNNPVLVDRYGPYFDAFEATDEPGIQVMRRAWDKFGYMLKNPQKFLSCQVIV